MITLHIPRGRLDAWYYGDSLNKQNHLMFKKKKPRITSLSTGQRAYQAATELSPRKNNPCHDVFVVHRQDGNRQQANWGYLKLPSKVVSPLPHTHIPAGNGRHCAESSSSWSFLQICNSLHGQFQPSKAAAGMLHAKWQLTWQKTLTRAGPWGELGPHLCLRGYRGIQNYPKEVS